MQKYDVLVFRTDYASATFRVEADTPDKASIKAEEEAHNYAFGCGNAEYEVDSVEEVKDA